MTRRVLTAAALKLPRKERALLVDDLLSSLAGKPAPGSEIDDDEIARRFADFDARGEKTVTWKAVQKQWKRGASKR